MLIPGQVFGVPFYTKGAAALADPDAAAVPVVKMLRNGVLDAGVSVPVTHVSAGRWVAAVTVPAYSVDDRVDLECQPVTVAGTATFPSLIHLGYVDSLRVSGVTAGTGPSAAAIAASLAATPLVPRTQDSTAVPTWADALLGGWVHAFGGDNVDTPGRTYVRYAWDRTPVRTFSLTTANVDGWVVPTARS